MAIVYLFLFQILLPAFEMAVVKPEKLQIFMDKRVLLQINQGREVRNFEFKIHSHPQCLKIQKEDKEIVNG